MSSRTQRHCEPPCSYIMLGVQHPHVGVGIQANLTSAKRRHPCCLFAGTKFFYCFCQALLHGRTIQGLGPVDKPRGDDFTNWITTEVLRPPRDDDYQR